MSTNPLDIQVGGDHYKKMKIQVVEFVHANKLDAFQKDIIKYTCRHKDKRGKEDLEKAIHYLQLYIELEYPEPKDTIRKEDKCDTIANLFRELRAINHKECTDNDLDKLIQELQEEIDEMKSKPVEVDEECEEVDASYEEVEEGAAV